MWLLSFHRKNLLLVQATTFNKDERGGSKMKIWALVMVAAFTVGCSSTGEHKQSLSKVQKLAIRSACGRCQGSCRID